MQAGRVGISVLISALSLVLLSVDGVAGERPSAASSPAATKAQRSSRLTLERPVMSLPTVSMMDSVAMLCFDDVLDQLINPGCFSNPSGGGGDCTSSNTHFMAQYFDPFDYLGEFAGTWRVKSLHFISNDGDTVWPSVGIVLQPFDNVQFPTPAELQSLQVTNVASPGDTSEVVVDLRSANVEFTVNEVMFMVLQFPQGGTLTGPLQGPGVLADAQGVDSECDFLTLDTGTTWLAPDPVNDPLDWGFAVLIEPVVAVEKRSWGMIKQLYRSNPRR
jgi:hypothetical protein